MKLYGKELDDELARRKQAKEERRSQRLTLRAAALARGLDPSEIVAYENGEDVCPHEKYIDQIGGFPVPVFIMKICEKCHKMLEGSMEKASEGNWERVREVCKRSMEKLSEGLSDKIQE